MIYDPVANFENHPLCIIILRETIFGMIECFLGSRKIATQNMSFDSYEFPNASLNLEYYLKVSMTSLLKHTAEIYM